MTGVFENGRGFLKMTGVFENGRGFLKMTGVFENGRGFLKMTSFAMTSFLKINVIGEFLKNISRKTTRIKQTNKFKNDILFINVYVTINNKNI